MPYRITEEIDNLITNSLNDNEFSKELHNLNLELFIEQIKNEILNNINNLNNLQDNLFREYDKLESLNSEIENNKIFLIELFSIILSSILLMFPLFLSIDFSKKIKYPLGYFTFFNFSSNIPVILLILIFIFVLLFVIRNNKKKKQKKENKLAFKNLKNSINKLVINIIIKPTIREILNKRQNNLYDTKLRDLEVNGLWMEVDKNLEISTLTKDRIIRNMKRLSGGSFGVAGPRGIGKSTLLKSICNSQIFKETDSTTLELIVSVPVKYNPKEFILHLFHKVCEKVILNEYKQYNINEIKKNRTIKKHLSINKKIILPIFSTLMLIMILSYISDLLFKNTHYFVFIISIIYIIYLFIFLYFKLRNKIYTADFEISNIAFQKIELINFQQSITNKNNIKAKFSEFLKINFELSKEESSTKVRKELILPEIINEYEEFISLISKKYKIIIGIDELDKISNVEIAQYFLNDIKAIFDINNCFYVLSISDNALSNFERKGIAFRDEFDTAFTDVLFIDPPSLKFSIKLFNRRILAYPRPFLYFCYCLSGGIPRDIIRTTRNLFDIAIEKGLISLYEIAPLCIFFDLKSKLRAFNIEIYNLSAEPEVSDLLLFIDRIKFDNNFIFEWLTIAEEIQFKIETYENSNSYEKNKVIRLLNELSSYLLFSSSLYQLFVNYQRESLDRDFSDLDVDSIEKLAKAKQLITTSPNYSRILIKECRNKFSL